MSANPNGVSMPRAERHARVVQLKESGLTFKEIARYFGVSRSTVTCVYYDPSGDKDRARKARNLGGTCVDCGEPTSYNAGAPAERCRGCRGNFSRSMEKRRVMASHQRGRVDWTDEQIFEALRAAAVDGKCTCTRYERLRRDGRLVGPSKGALVFRFGSWRNAVEAAGLSLGRNTPERYANRTPDEGLLAAIEDCAASLGRWPGAHEYAHWAVGGKAVTLSIIRQRFGSWMNALEIVVDRNDGVPS